MPLFASRIQTMLHKLKLNFTNKHSMERSCTSITMKSKKSERSNKKKFETRLITKTIRNKTKDHSTWTSLTDLKSLHLFNNSLHTCKDNNNHSDKIWATTEEIDHKEDHINNNNINQVPCHRNQCNNQCHNQWEWINLFKEWDPQWCPDKCQDKCQDRCHLKVCQWEWDNHQWWCHLIWHQIQTFHQWLLSTMPEDSNWFQQLCQTTPTTKHK